MLDRRRWSLDALGAGDAAAGRAALIRIGTHPLQNMVDTARPLTFDMPYADDGGHLFEGDGSYAVRRQAAPRRSVYYFHEIGKIVSAAARRPAAAIEHLHRSVRAPGRDPAAVRMTAGGGYAPTDIPLPLLFTLRATPSVDVP